MVGSNGFRILAVLPLATWVAVDRYASAFDGWGAWATGPLFLLPIALSAAGTGASVLRMLRERRARRIRASTALLTLLAATPLLWFAW